MKILFSHCAFKQLNNLDKTTQRKIIEKLNFYISQKDPLSFAKRIRDKKFGEFRFRIGDYRILFDLRKDRIFVLGVARREEVYK